MFIPDTLRSCMVEPDVSTYLQTPSSGQVRRAERRISSFSSIYRFFGSFYLNYSRVR
ncbi:UNVERIFIED_CONTAM: hypothetical protein PYX00_010295 [Menopon gallinae]|uniref:Uncharacterized protein n=1 Tax=Menopon gallinae TaxID=328185 RepID=A0AAW2HF17_9NEOP